MAALNYALAWHKISDRIRGLERAATLHATYMGANSSDPYGVQKHFQIYLVQIAGSLVEYQRVYGNALPQNALATLEQFTSRVATEIISNTAGDASLVRATLVKLLAFEAELSNSMVDEAETIRSTAELAFMHLQRLIVADKGHRNTWSEAFADSEPACERLGAVHLLWHGIWAFKVNAEGERTDLVYNDTRVGNGAARLGLVLTEWKRAKRGDGASEFEIAKNQARLYSVGALGGVELSSHRYLIVVSGIPLKTPADEIVDGVTFRCINIAVDPLNPSTQAKRARGKRPAGQ